MMKTLSCLFTVFLAQSLCCDLYGQQPSQPAPRVVEPLTRPAVSITQALSLAERELTTRGLYTSYIIKTVTLVRGPRAADSVYLAILELIEPAAPAPNSPASDNLHREFKIDMRGAVTFLEIPSTRVRVQQ